MPVAHWGITHHFAGTKKPAVDLLCMVWCGLRAWPLIWLSKTEPNRTPLCWQQKQENGFFVFCLVPAAQDMKKKILTELCSLLVHCHLTPKQNVWTFQSPSTLQHSFAISVLIELWCESRNRIWSWNKILRYQSIYWQNDVLFTQCPVREPIHEQLWWF